MIPDLVIDPDQGILNTINDPLRRKVLSPAPRLRSRHGSLWLAWWRTGADGSPLEPGLWDHRTQRRPLRRRVPARPLERPNVTSHESNARLADLIRARLSRSLSRADELGRARVPLKLSDRAARRAAHAPPRPPVGRRGAPTKTGTAPGNIMTLWAELPEVGTATRRRLIPAPHRPGQPM